MLNPKVKITYILLGFAFLSLGCASTIESLEPKLNVDDVSPDAGSYAKVPPDQIIVYVSEKFAPKHYVILATLSTKLIFPCDTEDAMFNLFRNKASELGANAVVVKDVQQTGEYVKIFYGSQPRNDLGYYHASSDESIVEVTPTPVSDGRKPRFVGQAYAIRTSP
jgi:hypothetical protein